MFTPLGDKNIGIRKFEFVAKTQFILILYFYNNFKFFKKNCYAFFYINAKNLALLRQNYLKNSIFLKKRIPRILRIVHL